MAYNTIIDLARQSRIDEGETARLNGSIILSENLTVGENVTFEGLVTSSTNLTKALFSDNNGKIWNQIITPTPSQFNPIAGTNITLTGSYPNITFNSTGVGLIPPFQAIDQGNGIGYIIRDRDNTKYGNVGKGSLDLSTNENLNYGYLGGAIGPHSVALGLQSLANNESTIAIGSGAQATAYRAVAINGRASGDNSVAINGVATAENSFATGFNSFATGRNSVSFGNNTSAEGFASFATGFGNHSKTAYSVSFGDGNIGYAYAVTTIGTFADPIITTVESDRVVGSPLFIVGNGTNGAPFLSNAYVLNNNATSTQYGIASYGGDYTFSNSRNLVTKGYVDSVLPVVIAGNNTTITSTTISGHLQYTINATGGSTIVIDPVPTSGSNNAVSSGGTFNALATKGNLIGGNTWSGNQILSSGSFSSKSYIVNGSSGSFGQVIKLSSATNSTRQFGTIEFDISNTSDNSNNLLTTLVTNLNLVTSNTVSLPILTGTLALDELVVHLAGNEIITGIKNFKATTTFDGGLISNSQSTFNSTSSFYGNVTTLPSATVTFYGDVRAFTTFSTFGFSYYGSGALNAGSRIYSTITRGGDGNSGVFNLYRYNGVDDTPYIYSIKPNTVTANTSLFLPPASGTLARIEDLPTLVAGTNITILKSGNVYTINSSGTGGGVGNLQAVTDIGFTTTHPLNLTAPAFDDNDISDLRGLTLNGHFGDSGGSGVMQYAFASSGSEYYGFGALTIENGSTGTTSDGGTSSFRFQHNFEDLFTIKRIVTNDGVAAKAFGRVEGVSGINPKDFVTLDQLTSGGGLIPPFQAIDQGNGIGYIVRGRTGNYGNVGNGAMDFSLLPASGTANGATGEGAVAFGNGVIASGLYSAVLGGGANTSSGEVSITAGYDNLASGYYATAIGNSNRAINDHSFALGLSNRSQADFSFAFGRGSLTTAEGAMGFGTNIVVNGQYSMGLGFLSTTNGYGSFASGLGTTANAFGSVAIGHYNLPIVSTGESTKVNGSPLMLIGNGTNLTASNAYELYNDGTSKQYGIASYAGDYTFSNSRNLVTKGYVDTILPTVVAGSNITVTPSTVSGHVQYIINSTASSGYVDLTTAQTVGGAKRFTSQVTSDIGYDIIDQTTGNFILSTRVLPSSTFKRASLQLYVNNSVGPTSYNVNIFPPTNLTGSVSLTLPSANGTAARLEDIPLVDSGTYTPVLTVGSNVTSSTVFLAHYIRVKNEVTVSGIMNITVTTGGNINISLPVVSDFTASQDLSGQGQPNSAFAANCVIQGDITANNALFSFSAPNSSAGGITYTFTYTVK